jgi:geranyl-CoA carboxylase alpha subunit
MTVFASVLIANRGEIACRIARTIRAMGLRVIAVYSDADAGAPHVRASDTAVRIGPAPAADSYLNVAALIAAARDSGAEAVHPGYGFLSENAAFAQAVLDAGLIWIGPPPAAIAAMGNKAQAKARMEAAGLPVVPGWRGDTGDDAAVALAARRIGLPIMVKAAAGGGGRGMRLVTDEAQLDAAIATARAEAASAFGSGEILLEKAVVDARHVEVQVFADSHGACIHLGERDCSLQRRHQKVVEEAPSPAVDEPLRARMGAAAIAAAQAVGYVGAGTVEFLLAPDGEFYFLEMNTRLQVEHPVTEAITGLDLVDWQIRVASGEALPLAQDAVRPSGHAIEARLYAEDPAQDDLPQSGDLLRWDAPPGVRVDAGVESGQAISPWYDPLLAKIIAHGTTRDEARRKLVAALERTVALGMATNRRFLIDVLDDDAFASGHVHTGTLAERFPAARRVRGEPDWARAAAAFMARAAGPHGELADWHSNGAAAWPLKLSCGTAMRTLTVTTSAATTAPHAFDRDGALWLDDRCYVDRTWAPPLVATTGGGDRVVAPMNGRLVALLVTTDETVTKGQRVAVVEAMKMQHELVAPRDGQVAEIGVAAGAQVAKGQMLVRLA